MTTYTSTIQTPSPSSWLSCTFLKGDYLGPSFMHGIYWESLPPPSIPISTHTPKPPIPPFTSQQHTATRPCCSWIIQAGRQAIALSFVGEEARTKDGQLTEQLWLSRLRRKTMVTSVSTDRGRRQRLQSKSHIQAPASTSVLPRQIPRLGTLPSRLRLQSKGRKGREKNYPLIFPYRCLACTKHNATQKQISPTNLFFPGYYHQIVRRSTEFSLAKNENFNHAKEVVDEVLRGHHQSCPLSLFNSSAPCQDFLFQSSSHLKTAWKYLTSPSTQCLE